MKTAPTENGETAFQRLYRTDPNFRPVADIAKGNGWTEQAVVQEYLMDLQAEEDDYEGL